MGVKEERNKKKGRDSFRERETEEEKIDKRNDTMSLTFSLFKAISTFVGYLMLNSS